MKKILLLTLSFALLLTSCDKLKDYFSGSPASESPKRYIREEIHSARAQKDVEALEKALTIMRKLPCENPLSWYYQGAIHWVPDTIQNNQLCASYNTPADLKEAWDNCTHTPSGKEKVHFLVWHRLYIYHFEKIVRKLSGYNDFALPYWGYTNANQDQLTLEKTFRKNGSGLYESCRFDSLNNGYPIQGEILRALELDKLMSYTTFEMFSNNINAAPHGAIHDYVGAGNDQTGKQFNNPITGTVSETGLMGWVPTAGFDPIFWTHHSNIDRIWQQWTNSPNGKKVTMDILRSADWNYTFFDENGKKVTYTYDDIIKIIYNLDYDFDDTKVYEKSDEQQPVMAYNNVVAAWYEGTAVNGQITDAITLMPNRKFSSQLSGKVKVLITVSFTKVPKGIYEVYLNANTKQELHPRNLNTFVGYMTFFGADHRMPGESCEKGCCRPLNDKGRPTMTFEYEVSESSKYDFKIYKHSGKHVGDLIIEEITIKK